MFLENNVNNLVLQNSSWFVGSNTRWQRHIYEDLFIRNYISSFLTNWLNGSSYNVIGSIYLFRTFGSLYVKVRFFYPTTQVANKRISFFSNNGFNLAFQGVLKTRPIFNLNNHLSVILSFFWLESLLGVQVFFNWVSICNPLIREHPLSSTFLNKVFKFLLVKFSYFNHAFSSPVYNVTLLCLINLFKFKNPDSALFARYIGTILTLLQKHTFFLLFLNKVLYTLKKFFSFIGVNVVLSGNLNGFSRAHSNKIQVGRIPLQTLTIPHESSSAQAFTTSGKIGINIWIY